MRTSTGSPRRLVLLGGPGGYLTVLPAGSPMRDDRYRGWTELLRMNVPRRLACRACVVPHVSAPGLRAADAMKQWALDVYGSAA